MFVTLFPAFMFFLQSLLPGIFFLQSLLAHSLLHKVSLKYHAAKLFSVRCRKLFTLELIIAFFSLKLINNFTTCSKL